MAMTQDDKSPAGSNDIGPLIHSTSLDSNILPFKDRKSAFEELSLYSLEITQSNPLPMSDMTLMVNRRHTVTPDLGELTLEEQNALQKVIAERMQARRMSNKKFFFDEEEEDRVAIGTRVAEGHRNYQLMLVVKKKLAVHSLTT